MKTKFRILQSPQLASDQGLHPLLAHVLSPATSSYSEASGESRRHSPCHEANLEVSSPLVIGMAVEHWYHPICSTQEGEDGRGREKGERGGERRQGQEGPKG